MSPEDDFEKFALSKDPEPLRKDYYNCVLSFYYYPDDESAYESFLKHAITDPGYIKSPETYLTEKEVDLDGFPKDIFAEMNQWYDDLMTIKDVQTMGDFRRKYENYKLYKKE
jgi:hypothetical protein